MYSRLVSTTLHRAGWMRAFRRVHQPHQRSFIALACVQTLSARQHVRSAASLGSLRNLQKANELLSEGLRMLDTGQAEQALSQFTASIKEYPSSEAYHNLANVYYQLGRFDDAIANWQTSISIMPSVEAHTNMANTCYLARKDAKQAIQHYERALELNPEDGEIWFNLGCVCDAVQELDKAIEAYGNAEKYGIERAGMLKRNIQAKKLGIVANRKKV